HAAQSIAGQPTGNLLRFEGIGKLAFHGAEPRSGGGPEAVQEWQFGEQGRNIRGQPDHAAKHTATRPMKSGFWPGHAVESDAWNATINAPRMYWSTCMACRMTCAGLSAMNLTAASCAMPGPDLPAAGCRAVA